ncbi:MAG: ATPase domain-containing protein [Sulfurifustaceae bacterium]
MEPEHDLRVSTGLKGMDEVLGGGLMPGGLYVVRGRAGAGKTTLGLQFLLDGTARGERALYLSLDHSRKTLQSIARSHRWSLDRLIIHCAEDSATLPAAGQTIFAGVDVELADYFGVLHRTVEAATPRRVVFDSVAALRLVARDANSIRRELQRFKRYLSERACTTLLLDAGVDSSIDAHLDALADGVILLESRTREFGGTRRLALITKMPGVAFRDGYHDYRIGSEGVVLFPRLIANDDARAVTHETVSSGLPALDEMLGGGIDRGTCVVLAGPSGVGKSGLAARVSAAAAERDDPVALYLFDEQSYTWLVRADGLGIRLRPHLASGRMRMRALAPGEWTPGEFADSVRRAVEEDHARMIVIDGHRGYRHAMLDDPFATQQLGELACYARERGVILFVLAAEDLELGYMDDSAIVFRRYRTAGDVRTAIRVLKRRTQAHRSELRDFRLGPPEGVAIGAPVAEIRMDPFDP